MSTTQSWAHWDKPMATYRDIMTEVRLRMSWIDYATQGRTGITPPLVKEFGYLQLRMICELVALGSLVAHGEIVGTKSKKFQGAFSADAILKGLEGLNPDFYPQAFNEVTEPDGSLRYEDTTTGCMTKAELLRLYGHTCGNALHKGNLKNLLKPKQPVQKNYLEISGPTVKLARLLNMHRIALADGDIQLVCHMQPLPLPVIVRIAVADDLRSKH